MRPKASGRLGSASACFNDQRLGNKVRVYRGFIGFGESGLGLMGFRAFGLMDYVTYRSRPTKHPAPAGAAPKWLVGSQHPRVCLCSALGLSGFRVQGLGFRWF